MAFFEDRSSEQKYKFVSEPDDELKCLICLEVAMDPMQHEACGKLFCKDCLESYGRTKPCPNCRIWWSHYYKDNRSRRNIQALGVKCDNSTCTWKGTVATLKMHGATCEFTLLPCPNQCQDNSDNIAHLMRKDLPHHLERDCPNRVIACKYENIGCCKEFQRREMAVHELDDKIHLHMAIDTVNELKAEKKVLMNPQGDAMTFKLTGFYGGKSEDQIFYSPSFYTSSQGYHMKMRVDPNGCGASKGTVISAFAMVLDGKYDDDITWPFQGKVTLDLLNQLENKNHHIRNILSGGPGNEYNKYMRPGGCGFGIGTFIPHSQLGHNPYYNTQYLKDDTLYFRVSVDIPDHKPWLECTD